MWKTNNITIRLVDKSGFLSTTISTQKTVFSTIEKEGTTINSQIDAFKKASPKQSEIYTKIKSQTNRTLKQMQGLYTNPQTLLRRLLYLYIFNLLNCSVEKPLRNENK